MESVKVHHSSRDARRSPPSLLRPYRRRHGVRQAPPTTPKPMPPPWTNSRGGAEEWSTPAGEACKRRAAWTDRELTAADLPSHRGFVPALRCTSSVRQLQFPYNHGLHPWSFPCLQQLLDSRKLSVCILVTCPLKKT